MSDEQRDTERDDVEAEYRRELADGYWDPPAEFDPPAPTKHGWAPDPYPGGSLV